MKASGVTESEESEKTIKEVGSNSRRCRLAVEPRIEATSAREETDSIEFLVIATIINSEITIPNNQTKTVIQCLNKK